MSRTVTVPPRPDFAGEAPSQARVAERSRALASRRRETLERVDTLARTQADVGKELSSDLGALKDKGHALDAIERSTQEAGFVASLVRRFTRRRALLERRSATEELLGQYEKVSVRLRRASAFSDELRLCALELQRDVEELNSEYASAKSNAGLAARQLLEIEQALDALTEQKGADELGQLEDSLEFELRTSAVNLQIFEAAASVCAENIGPARELRDTVMNLHEELSEFIVRASGTVNQSGRRIQALGMAADAPAVVAELQESLSELQDAMEITTAYVENTRHLVGTVLPRLTAELEAHKEVQSIDGLYQVDDITRESARRAAQRALREATEAAEAEVEAWLQGEEPRTRKEL